MHARYVNALKQAFGIHGEDNPTALPRRLMEILGEMESQMKPMATGASIGSSEICFALQIFNLEKRLLDNGVNIGRMRQEYELRTPAKGTVGAVRAERPIAPNQKKVATATAKAK